MSNRNTPAIIRAILETKSLESSEILTVRRWFYGDGILHEEDAVAMFAANRVLCGSNLEFNKLFVEAITDFVVYQQMPTGRVSAEQADWLIARMGGPGGHVETVGEIDLLVNIMEEAHEIPTQLAAFAISQVKHAAITGEGPAARGRVHFSRTVDGRDVELLSRMLIYEDKKVIVLNKPHGLPVQGGSGVYRNVDKMLEAWTSPKGEKPMTRPAITAATRMPEPVADSQLNT